MWVSFDQLNIYEKNYYFYQFFFSDVARGWLLAETKG
jgi:hypothetical protein